MAFGRKSGRDIPHGDKMKGRQAKTATGSGGGVRGDGKIVDPKGKVIGSVAGRKLRDTNEHGG
ncbi:hypothetical protein OG558_37340 [Kribbella sp. NBC_01510]|uniref:hypothetical protein n=1 Tax=unclassified Kribbella TaxID=2644121 RepID=UPI002E3234CF|nr:hypothetical protein [Kribbella sp. NBC_01484]